MPPFAWEIETLSGGRPGHARPPIPAQKTGAAPRKEPLRCCPGEGIRRNGRFCRASRASITSALPTTLTLPTH